MKTTLLFAALITMSAVGATDDPLGLVDTKPAVLIKKVDARPPKAGLIGFRGTVIRACFTITVEGKVEDIVFPDEGRQEFFDSTIRRALIRWRYEPALKAGQPVAQLECVSFEIRAIGG